MAIVLLSMVLPAPAQLVSCYPQGTVFPLMMYEVTPSSAAPSCAACGWNVIQSYGLTTTSAVNSFLQVALTNKISADVVIPDNVDTNGNAIEWPQAQAQTWIEALATNSNIAWWDLPEEMKPWEPSQMQLLADYTAWTRLYDPARRPTYEYTANNRTAGDISTISPNVDILGISCYCEFLGMPHAWVRYKLQDVGVQGVLSTGAALGSNYPAGEKTLIADLYCATNSNGTVASPAECYHDVWSAIASGAQGIAVFAYWHALNDSPELTNNLQQYNLAASQIAGPEQIGRVILFGIPNTNVTFAITSGPSNTVTFSPPGATNISYPSLNLLCKTWSNKVYLVAVNSTSNSVSATLSNLPLTTATALLPFETNSVAISNASLTAVFPPWGVHIYKMTPPPPTFMSITVTNGTAWLACSGAPSFRYILQCSTNLLAGRGWADTATNTGANSGLFSFTNRLPAQATYYRLRVP